MAVDVQALINMLLGSQSQPVVPSVPGTGQNMNMNLLAALSRQSPSSISSAFSPEVLLASGLFNPQNIQSAVSDIYGQQTAKFQQDLAPYMVPIQGAPTPEQFFSYARNTGLYQANPIIADVLLDPNTGVFAKLSRGEISADKAKRDILQATVEGKIPLTTDQVKMAQDEIDTYSRELPQYRETVAKAEAAGATKSAENQAMINALMANAPTEQGAYAEFAKSIGMPQLALLPKPYEQYQFQPELFVRPEIYNLATRVKGSAEQKIAELAPAAEKRAGYISGVQQAGVARAKGAAEMGAASKATQAKKAYIEDAQKKADYFRTDAGKKEFIRMMNLKVGPNAKTIVGPSINAQINTWLNGQKKQADTVYSNVLASEKAKFQGSIVAPTVTPESLAPGLRSARRAQSTALKLAGQEYGRGVSGAQQLTGALTAAGITPFQQALLNLYNVPLSSKKKG